MPKKQSSRRKKTQQRINQIRREIVKMNFVCPGTLSERYNTCGKANCRCAKDPSARHGPYYDWTRRERGRFVHSLVSPAQADEIKQAIKNYKRALELLAKWARASAALILADDGAK